jgi:hypothetical protein
MFKLLAAAAARVFAFKEEAVPRCIVEGPSYAPATLLVATLASSASKERKAERLDY